MYSSSQMRVNLTTICTYLLTNNAGATDGEKLVAKLARVSTTLEKGVCLFASNVHSLKSLQYSINTLASYPSSATLQQIKEESCKYVGRGTAAARRINE